MIEKLLKLLRYRIAVVGGQPHPCKRLVYLPKESRRPITLRLPLIGYQPAEELAKQLLGSGLRWWWCCWWKEHFPWDYPLQELSDRTKERFSADFRREEDMFLYFLDLYGFSPEVRQEVSHSFLAHQLMAFYEEQPTFLQVYLTRLDDEPEECTYISVCQQRQRSDEVLSLFNAWGIEADLHSFSVVKGEWSELKSLVGLYRRRFIEAME